jgi:hypothetical protein
MRQQSFIKRLIVLQGVILLLLIALSACFQRDVVVVVATPTPAPETPTAEEPSEMTSIPTEEATDEPDEEPGSPRRPTVASVPTVRPENTQEPTSGSIPVSAPVNLSTLEDPVQETIQWVAWGAGIHTGDIPCPNQTQNGEWLVVGGLEELKTSSVKLLPPSIEAEDFQEGIAPGIGREAIICAHFREELRRGDRITLEVVKPEGTIERATFAYNPTSDPELTLMAEDFQRYIDHSFEDDNLTLVYAPRQGSPVGTYVIILRINEREVARQSLQVELCDCPNIRLSGPSTPNMFIEKQILIVGDILEIEFTGFKSNEQLRMILFDLQMGSGQSRDTYPSGVTRYSWLAQLDERGEYYRFSGNFD